MVLPPIIANNPLVKLLRAEGQPKHKDAAAGAADSGGSSRDVVEISEAARRKLGEAQALSESRAREVAAETRNLLSGDKSQTLGLDPGFDG